MSLMRADQVRSTAEASFVLPKPGRQPNQLVVDREGPAVRASAAREVRLMGLRIEGLVQCQDMFLGELRRAVREALAAAGPDHAVAARLEAVQAILDWSEALQGDLHDECRRAAAGQQPLDLAEVCGAVVQDYSVSAPALRLVQQGAANQQVWAARSGCTRLVRLAVELVVARTGGRASVALEVDEDAAGPAIHVHSQIGPVDDVPAALAAAFRAQADEVGAVVAPDESGSGGAGMILRFPGSVVRPVPGLD